MAAECEGTARRAREVAARIERELAEDLARVRTRLIGTTGPPAETIHPAATVRRQPPEASTDPPDDTGDRRSRTEAA
jgi:hypothetical protein